MEAAVISEPSKVIPIEQKALPPVNTANFLKENWKLVLSLDCPENLKYVRVIHSIATITNGKIVIRCPVNYPDGFYYVGEKEPLIYATPPKYFSYPDTES